VSGLLVGVDVGTQSVKTGIFTPDGDCRAESASPLPLHRFDAEHVEQDPEDFVVAAAAGIAACLRAGGCDPGEVAGVAVAGQMAGILGVGSDGHAVTPYDSWLDTRCRTEVEEIERRCGDEVVERTGCPPMVAHAAKILWWRRHRPLEHARVARFVVPSAYVAGRLCGLAGDEAFVDGTHLHFSGLADNAAGAWSPELVDEVGVDAERLPRILAPTELVGSLTRAAADASGLRPGTPVAAGLGDTAAGALGAGVVDEGQLLDVAGTAAVLAVSTRAFRPDPARTLIAMRGAVPGQWISLSYLAGGDLLRWLPQALGERSDGAASLASLLAEAVAAEPGRVLFVPHLGGRILPPAPGARGAWLGLDLAHGRADLARAVLESVALEYALYLQRARELFPELEPSEVRVIGGGAGNRAWDGIKAAALGLPYVGLRRESFGSWGAALVAGAAVGLVPDLAAAALEGTNVEERVEPEPALAETYARLLPEYRDASEWLVGRLSRLEELPA